MSKVQGVPFIQSVIDSLTDELKKDLLDLVNGEEKTPVFRSLINKQHAITAGTDKNKVQFVFLETWNKNYTGYLIYNNSYCVLVGFNANTQDMSIVNIDVAKQTCKLVKQTLSILEFRFCLQDAADHVTSGEIDSGEASAGQVLTADGDGGAEWADVADLITEDNVEAGDAVKLFGFDSQGNLVADDMPEGILVDETIIEDSPNAVAGGAVYDALADINAELETKANVDGNYPTMTVGVADQLSPYDEESGDDQDEPFSFQATGTGNGTQPDFSTGAIALMKEKRGNTVAVNQQLRNPDFSGSSYWVDGSGVSSLSIANNQATIVTSGTIAYPQISTTVNLLANHKFLFYTEMKCESADNIYKFAIGNSSAGYVNVPASTNWSIVCGIKETVEATTNLVVYVQQITAQADETFYVRKAYCIDLTQWFNGDIPQDLLDNPENFFRYYQGSLAYNTGELVNANGRYIKCIGRQQWDEEWELGKLNTSTGATESSSSQIRSKNYIRIIGNRTYYFKANPNMWVLFYDANKNVVSLESDGTRYIVDNAVQLGQSGGVDAGTFTTPTNAIYCRFYCQSTYGTTYQNDITISIYYEGESGYDQYYPYEVLTNNDTGTETLLAFDKKLPDGTIHRNTISYTFTGSESWSEFGQGYSCSVTLNCKNNANNTKAKAVSPIGQVVTVDTIHGTSGLFASYALKQNTIYISADLYSNVSNLTGKIIQVESATPTTEQGTSYSENLVIDDFGSMDFSGTNGVPQGNLIFYPVDYKAFIDTLYDYTEGTPSNVALKSDLPTAPQTWAESLPGYDATKTQTLKNVEGTLTWVDDE